MRVLEEMTDLNGRHNQQIGEIGLRGSVLFCDSLDFLGEIR